MLVTPSPIHRAYTPAKIVNPARATIFSIIHDDDGVCPVKNDRERIKGALLKRALGYDYEEKEIVGDPSGKPIKVKVLKRHAPPDMSAIREVLRRMDQDNW